MASKSFFSKRSDIIQVNEKFVQNQKYDVKSINKEQSYKKDLPNILFLILLYMLQGVPIGLSQSLPYILSFRHVSYTDQGTFSLSSWPYSMKLLWAPIVDAFFSRRIGRRKSWLVPVQYLIGLCMLIFSNYVHNVLEDEKVNIHDNINALTGIFFLFTFLSATQDIAVDGWGLTILSSENLEWASIANNAGGTAGVLIGNSLFLVLESEDFCNELIRPYLGLSSQTYGMVSLKDFMNFFGAVYIISTTIILLMKNEKNSKYETYLDEEKSIKETYTSLWQILKLKPVRTFMFILLTCKIAFATTHVRTLKMIEAGVPKEKLGLMNAPFQIIQILTPIFFGKFINVNKPLSLFLKIYPMRILMTVILAVWVYYTPSMTDSNNEYPWMFFFVYTIINGFYSLIFSSLSFTKILFFTQISDKLIGGTYMTLLNTISNIGVSWPSTFALYLIDLLSFKRCENQEGRYILQNMTEIIASNTCSGELEIETCIKYGAQCVVFIDAFYYLTCVLVLFGIVWLMYYSKIMLYLQELKKSCWKIDSFPGLRKSIIL